MKNPLPLAKKLNRYAATATAFLLTAPVTQGAVVYTDVDPDETYNRFSSFNIDLNNDGTHELEIEVSTGLFPYSIRANPNSGVAINAVSGFYPNALAYGNNIGSSITFSGTSIYQLMNGSSSYGNWMGGNIDAYLAVRFMIGANTHYGYVHLNVVSPTQIILMDYAYEDTPNTSISAGAQPLLPVELSSFKAQAQQDHIHLLWQTQLEIENHGFEIQRATEAFEWQSIAWQEGQGTTTQAQTYIYEDRNALLGIEYYYRLKQIALDGDFHYSDIVSATLHKDRHTLASISPNPVINGQATLEIYSPKGEDATISIFSSEGKLVDTQNMNLQGFHSRYELDLHGMASGIYFIKVVASGESAYQKVVVH